MAAQDPIIIIITPPPRRTAKVEESAETIADPIRKARQLLDAAEEQGCQVQVRD